MDLNQFLIVLNSKNLIEITFKILVIFFSVFYLLYAIVLFKQAEVMTKTLETKGKEIFIIISLIQIFAGIIILISAIFLV